MSVKPVVDAVEREFSGKLKVIRLNIQDPAGKALAQEYGFQFTPTFILLDGDGQEAWRSVFALDPAQIRSRLTPD
jgi:thioredoxin-related protein